MPALSSPKSACKLLAVIPGFELKDQGVEGVLVIADGLRQLDIEVQHPPQVRFEGSVVILIFGLCPDRFPIRD